MTSSGQRGETALEIMKDWAPDLVITDLAMPNMGWTGVVPAAAGEDADSDHRVLSGAG